MLQQFFSSTLLGVKAFQNLAIALPLTVVYTSTTCPMRTVLPLTPAIRSCLCRGRYGRVWTTVEGSAMAKFLCLPLLTEWSHQFHIILRISIQKDKHYFFWFGSNIFIFHLLLDTIKEILTSRSNQKTCIMRDYKFYLLMPSSICIFL